MAAGGSAFLQLILFLSWILISTCVTPTAEMKIRQQTDVLYLSPGSFGASLSDEGKTTFRKLIKPTGDVDGCDPTVPRLPHNQQFYLLVARGNCSFVDKAIAAENVGAKGVVIYNSLEGIYQGNDYASETDYECDNGSGYVTDLIYPVYSDEMNSLMPTECTADSKCASQRCVVTNTTTDQGTRVCCAWDLYMTMGASSDNDVEPGIPAVFIRMQDADTLFGMPELDSNSLDVSIYNRSNPVIDFASVLIWMLAVSTVAVGASRAAEEDKVLQLFSKEGIVGSGYDGASVMSDDDVERNRRQSHSAITSAGIAQQSNAPTNSLSASSTTAASMSNGSSSSSSSSSSFQSSSATLSSSLPSSSSSSAAAASSSSSSSSSAMAARVRAAALATGVPQPQARTVSMHSPFPSFDGSERGSVRSRDFEPAVDENSGSSLDITPYHAVAFVIVSSCFLLLLYFVDLYFFVTIMYLVSAALASTIIFFYPAVKSLFRRLNALRLGIHYDSLEYTTLSDTYFDIPFVLSSLLSIAISATWYFNSDASWVWLIQDFLGVSVCIMFLCAVRLPNLKTATILLGLAFFYDVFFVFISPYIFNSSVMVQVATGPTTSHDDENFCEKYPDDETCQTTELPMLLVVPTFSSYLSSESMLGLGDIVLPGLLLVWTARLDMRRYGSLSSESASKGYFPMCLFGYAVGLLAANVAVEYFQTGQPALLYIVPVTLGSVLYRSYQSGSLKHLWRALPAMHLIALPYTPEEQERLMGRPDVIETVATWKNNVDAVVLLRGGGASGTENDSSSDRDDCSEDIRSPRIGAPLSQSQRRY